MTLTNAPVEAEISLTDLSEAFATKMRVPAEVTAAGPLNR
jgi:hypothetical protein